MSKSRKFDEILKIRRVWWARFFELSHAIHELKVSKAKKEEISQRMGGLIWVFNAACFRSAAVLDEMPPAIPQARKQPPARRAPAPKRNLKLIPPRPTVH